MFFVTLLLKQMFLCVLFFLGGNKKIGCVPKKGGENKRMYYRIAHQRDLSVSNSFTS